MKLYLSSIGIPDPDKLAELIGKPLAGLSVALIPNAKDYFVDRARNFVVANRIALFESLGMKVSIVDLRDYKDGAPLKGALSHFDLIWAMGGNTFMLRYQMRRAGFDAIIQGLLEAGVIYGGDSAGALVAGSSIGGINLETSDEPAFADEVVEDGLKLVPYVIVPHTDNPEFAEVMESVDARTDQEQIIRLRDDQAVVFTNGDHQIV